MRITIIMRIIVIVSLLFMLIWLRMVLWILSWSGFARYSKQKREIKID